MPTRSGRNYQTKDNMSDTEATPGVVEVQNVAGAEEVQAELPPGDSTVNPQVPMDPLQLHYMVQQQQLRLLEEQRRVMELNLTEKPVLSTLLPEDVNKFLIEWEVYSETLRATMGIRDPMIQQCIKIKLMSELKALGADVKDKNSVLEILTELRDQDHEARKHFLVERVKQDVMFVNRGNIPASMRSYLLAAEKSRKLE